MKNCIKKLAAISLAIAIISSLTVSVSAFGFYETENNDTVYTANEISVNTEIKGNIHHEDDQDYYKFTLYESSKVVIDLPETSLESLWDFYLFNEDGTSYITEEECYSFGYDHTGEIETLRLPAGTYCILIKSFYSNSFTDEDYKFTVNAIVESNDYEKEYNNTPDTANEIETNTEIKGNIHILEDKDYYKFTLDEASKVVIDLPKTSLESLWDFYLYNEDGTSYITEEECYSFGYDRVGEIETLRLPAGTYCILINSFYSNSFEDEDYKFTVNVTPEATQVQQAPAKPTGLSISASSSGITIKWKPVSKAVGYKVYRATSKNGKYTWRKTITSTSYTDKSVVGGKKYFYKVKAYGSNSVESVFSAKKSIKAKAKISAPTKITCSSKLIKWNKAKNAKKYQIKVYDNTKKSKLVFSSTTKKTSIKAKFTKNHKYLIKIRSVSGSGKSQVYSEYKTYTYKSK